MPSTALLVVNTKSRSGERLCASVGDLLAARGITPVQAQCEAREALPQAILDHQNKIDLVVIADTGLPFCDRIGQALSACYAASTRLAVEALVYTPEEWRRMLESGSSFAQLVEREGRVLYDGESQSHRSAAVAPAGAA